MNENMDDVRKSLILLIEDWMKQVVGMEKEEPNNKKEEQETEKTSVNNVLSVRDLAAFLGVSTDSVYAMVREKQIPYFKVRRRILFHRNTVEQWCKKKWPNPNDYDLSSK